MGRVITCYTIGQDRGTLEALSGFTVRSSELVLVGAALGCAIFWMVLGRFELISLLLIWTGKVCLGSSRDLALDAFDLGAVDFLLKSLNKGRFLRAVHKVKRNLDAALPVCVEQVLP